MATEGDYDWIARAALAPGDSMDGTTVDGVVLGSGDLLLDADSGTSGRKPGIYRFERVLAGGVYYLQLALMVEPSPGQTVRVLEGSRWRETTWSRSPEGAWAWLP